MNTYYKNNSLNNESQLAILNFWVMGIDLDCSALFSCNSKETLHYLLHRRLRLTCCNIEANYWQTRSIARALCDSMQGFLSRVYVRVCVCLSVCPLRHAVGVKFARCSTSLPCPSTCLFTFGGDARRDMQKITQMPDQKGGEIVIWASQKLAHLTAIILKTLSRNYMSIRT